MQLQEASLQTSTASRQVVAAPQPEASEGRARSLGGPPKEPSDRAPRTGLPSLETGQRSRARLSFDPEAHRVFVEIIDPKTGDVITRFPPEQIATHIDEVLEQTGQQTNLQDAGLIVDRSV